jgi:hypothetical protein
LRCICAKLARIFTTCKTMRQLQPWMIAAWPIIERTVEPAMEIASDLHHLGTTVSDDCDDYGRLLGHTIWGGATSGIGIAWDWVEALDGVFAMADPMGVVSNIGFVDPMGTSMPEYMAAVQLNHITHALPWQLEVAAATRQVRATQPWSERVRASRSRSHARTSQAFPGRSSVRDSSWMNA